MRIKGERMEGVGHWPGCALAQLSSRLVATFYHGVLLTASAPPSLSTMLTPLHTAPHPEVSMQGLCEIRNIVKKCSVRVCRFDCISQFSVQFKIQLFKIHWWKASKD